MGTIGFCQLLLFLLLTISCPDLLPVVSAPGLELNLDLLRLSPTNIFSGTNVTENNSSSLVLPYILCMTLWLPNVLSLLLGLDGSGLQNFLV